MPNLTNYHSHTLYCDGRASMRDFIRFALSYGFTSYGFSPHAPLPFQTTWTMEPDQMDQFITEFRQLKEEYADRIDLYVGMEIDYLNEMHNPSIPYFQALPLDYRIGSVHMLYDGQGEVVDIDVPPATFKKIVKKKFCGDLELVIRLYYHRLKRMLELGGFDIVGHADKIHYNASCYHPGLMDELWYDVLVREYFAEIVRRGYQIEINTKSYLDTSFLFPDDRYLPFLHELGAKVQVNSDAHYPDRINSGRPEALRALRQAGFETVMELRKGKWEEVPIR